MQVPKRPPTNKKITPEERRSAAIITDPHRHNAILDPSGKAEKSTLNIHVIGWHWLLVLPSYQLSTLPTLPICGW